MSGRLTLALALIALSTASANAVELGPYFKVDGYGDVRLVFPSEQESWQDGGLGKLRWGEDDKGLDFTEGVAAARAQITEDFTATAVIRIEDYQKTLVDVMEAFARYRPVSTNNWRYAVKVGAFFPPISEENTEIGWTSPWTLTPSAINSWVGDELRTVGGEGEIEWRSDARTISAVGSVYWYNDPAGVLIAFHGWTLEDRPMTMIERSRVPDALGGGYAQEINETDGRPGWYAGLTVDETGFAKVSVLYFDNRAEPDSFHHGNFGWRTKFWNVGLKTGYDDFELLAQAAWGDTTVEPQEEVYSVTRFKSAYVLLGWYIDDNWKLAGRAEWFTARDGDNFFDEDGYALTAALSWLPEDWVRLTAEIVRVKSKRFMRVLEGDPQDVTETQFQLSGRVYF